MNFDWSSSTDCQASLPVQFVLPSDEGKKTKKTKKKGGKKTCKGGKAESTTNGD